MAELNLYEGKSPVIVDNEAVFALIAFVRDHGQNQAFLDGAKPFEGELKVNRAATELLQTFVVRAGGEEPDAAETLQRLFEQVSFLEMKGLQDDFLQAAVGVKATIEAGPDLVNYVKKFLDALLPPADSELRSLPGRRRNKVEEVVRSPQSTTSCFPKSG
jgi:hypothetical protein